MTVVMVIIVIRTKLDILVVNKVLSSLNCGEKWDFTVNKLRVTLFVHCLILIYLIDNKTMN